MPLAFLLHEGSPNDAKLFYQILKELKKRIIREGDVVIADKLLQLKNYLKYYEVQNRSFNLPEEELQFEQSFRLALIFWTCFAPIA